MVEVTPQTEMMAIMMQAMNSTMSKQQEFFMKILEDKDASNRRNKMVMENVLIVGSGGTGNAIQTDELANNDTCRGEMTCSYKSFLCSKPPEFAGSDDPVACMNWIWEKEQAFGANECDESQINLGLVGHVAPTKNERIKAYLKGLPENMISMVGMCKPSTLREAIEEGQIMEDVYAWGKEERAVVEEKKIWENNVGSLKRSRPFTGGRGFDNLTGGIVVPETPKQTSWHLQHGKVVNIYGEKRKGDVAVITMDKARRFLVKGCSSFLAYVIDAKLEKKKLKDVRVVREFPDVSSRV
ncbi:hypothetical protein L6452_31161 [Arctium lappa]|uniref:Uncharacterized protein n=1 Tax=Arctium lappa TaxID=4217 RepID=A0ACB8ZL36_ARCLA|nr:hypothetical protein L6452_31161 [Arctium lappa]